MFYVWFVIASKLSELFVFDLVRVGLDCQTDAKWTPGQIVEAKAGRDKKRNRIYYY